MVKKYTIKEEFAKKEGGKYVLLTEQECKEVNQRGR